FGGGVVIVERHGRVVDRRHGEVDGGEGAVGLAVVGLVGEAVGAGVVGHRGVGEAAVGVKGETAMGGLTGQDGVQGGAIDITVVAEHADGGHAERGVFGGGITVVDGDRRVVHISDGEGDGGEGGIDQTVIGLVGERVDAQVIGRGQIAETAVAVEAQG